MSQEHLDQHVVNAVLGRITAADSQPPRAHPEAAEERNALRREIQHHHLWLGAVRRETRRRDNSRVLDSELRRVLPQIDAAQKHLDLLDQLDPHVTLLAKSQEIRRTWATMPLGEQRHVIRSLVVPRVNPVLDDEQGSRGLNTRRVDLDWR